ncbi:MAG: hypothetical protein HQL46_14235 [Gammaproteobacteria bacterium]|nr:hypothetical protein [Gammaproteobacteria bacterium]
MTTLDIVVNFKEYGILKLYKKMWTEDVLQHWHLRSSDFSSKYKFEWYFVNAEITISGEDFLDIVGSSIEEALGIILKNNAFLSIDEAQEYITPEVKEFYKLLKTDSIISVLLKLTDQS